MIKNIHFQVKTPHGVLIRTTKEYWQKIVTAYLTDRIKEGEQIYVKT